MWTLTVVFTAAEGGLMEPTVAAVRRLDLCGCSKQRYFSCVCLCRK